MLYDSPCLKYLVGLEGLIFYAYKKGGGVAYGIVYEGDEVPLVLVSGDSSWSPYVSMYLISKVLGWWADSHFRYGQSGGMCKYACVAVHFL